MQARRTPRPRGRPRGETKGAKEAIAAIQEHVKAEGVSLAELAISLRMNPSSVSRAVNQVGTPRWTPSLRRIYRDALNGKASAIEGHQDAIASMLSKLLQTPAPAAHAVRAIIGDVQQLVDALSPPRRPASRRKR